MLCNENKNTYQVLAMARVSAGLFLCIIFFNLHKVSTDEKIKVQRVGDLSKQGHTFSK